MFWSAQGNPIDPSTLRRFVVRSIAERAGLTPGDLGFTVTPHVLRASGADVGHVAMMLGHKSHKEVDVVMRYLRYAQSDRYSDVSAAMARIVR